ncbi:MAG: AbgT family transporter [Pseudomonadota bacterium]
MSLLDRLESWGNRLPHPASVFAFGTLVVIALSELAVRLQWQVAKPGIGTEAVTVSATSLLASDGLWWLISNLVENFVTFPPLGIVLVGMLGIGVAERGGLINALLEAATRRINAAFLTPAVILIGILSSIGLDAGYVILPPLAAALFVANGRSPLVGIGAAFAGISAGFSANFSLTAIDPLLAGFTEAAAQFINADYQVAETCNWWFMIASTIILTATAWFVSAVWVEPRATITGSPLEIDSQPHRADDRALMLSILAAFITGAIFVAATVIPGAPLNGVGARFPRWVEATVPLIFIFFFVPGVVYGFMSGKFKSDQDVAAAMGETLASMGPYIVLAFCAAQFIAAFKFSGLGQMLAITGGEFLVEMGLPSAPLVMAFIGIVMLGNLVVGSASAKYAFFAPVFVPMLMQVGISPELTQAAYRVGDSITNVITPLNPYMIIIVSLVQRYLPNGGLGTVMALMVPYCIAFAIVWPVLLGIWMFFGWPLGPAGPLWL